MAKKKLKKSLLIYVIIIFLIAGLEAGGVLDNADYSATDAMYQTGGVVSPNIYVIGVDEETLSTYGAWETFSRDKVADLINLLTEDPENAPAVIALDIGYYGTKDAEIDTKLAKAVKKAGNVVLCSSAAFGRVNVENEDGSFYTTTAITTYEQPYQELLDAAAAVGYSNVDLDEDGVVRHAMGSMLYDGNTINSFAYEVFKTYVGEGNTASGDFATEGKFYINYTGTPRQYFGSGTTGASMSKVLSGEYPARAFKNSIVLIGAYASGQQDNYYTSIDKTNQMYGVEIHANIVNQLLDGVQKNELTNAEKAGVTIVLGLIALIFMSLFTMKLAAPLSIILGIAYIFGAKWAYGSLNVVLPVVAPVLAIALTVVIYIAVSYFAVYMEKRKLIANYSKYLSPDVAKQIADIGEDALSLGGQKRDIAVLFVDVRGFTTLSESLTPERVVEMLNSYFKVTTSAIFNNEGTVDKFIGDATMGIFNAPLELEDYTFKAVCAGLDMAKNAEIFAANLPDDLKGRVGFGIGVNCGDAVIGNIGTDFRMEYTAIGDTVNTASRLEGQAKAGNVIISEAVYERVKDRIRCVDMGKVKLKGKAEELQIYRAMEVIE